MNITDSDTFALLQERANDPAQGDDFIVKVDFKANPAGIPRRLAIFQHVFFEQLAMAEPWLQQISGNAKGHFVLFVTHAHNPSKAIGAPLTFALNNGKVVNEPTFDWAAFDSETYSGPKDFTYPSRESATPIATTTAPSATPTPVARTTPNSIGELVPLLQEIVRKKDGPDPFARFMEMQQEDRRRDESRRSEERERQEKRDEREAVRLREEKKEERDREEKKEERDRQYRLEMAAQAQKSQETLMQVLLREPPKNPLLEQLVAKSINSGDEQAAKAGALIGQMGMIMQQSMNMSLQMIHTQAELASQNQPQSPMWDLAGKLVEGYFGMQGAQEDEIAEVLEEKAKELPEGDVAPEDAATDETPDVPEEEPSVENPLQRFDRAIHQEAPLRELADALCMALVTPDFQRLYSEAKGNWQALVNKRYGSWVESKDSPAGQRKAIAMRRIKYLSTMLPKAYRVAQQRGIIKPPPTKKDPHAKPQPQASKKKPSGGEGGGAAPALAAVPEPKKEPAA